MRAKRRYYPKTLEGRAARERDRYLYMLNSNRAARAAARLNDARILAAIAAAMIRPANFDVAEDIREELSHEGHLDIAWRGIAVND